MEGELLERYARLIVGFGANIQPGQQVLVITSTEAAPLVRAIAAACYDRGAIFVDPWWFDPYVKRIRALHDEVRRSSLEAEANRRSLSELELQIGQLDLQIEAARNEVLLSELELARNNEQMLEALDTERRLLDSIQQRKLYLRTRLRAV